MNYKGRGDFVVLVVTTSIMFGLIIRLLPAIMAGSPISDGGLFYQMVRDLAANHYRPPLYTEYNRLNIPFVYPPLGFYLTAFAQDVTGVDLYQVFRYFPPLLATLTIPAMWFLSSLLLKDRLRGAIAAFFYAVIPVSFNLLFMGGGITRAPGMVFSLLTLGFLYLLFTTQTTRYALPTAVSAALLVLSHPEAAYHTVFSAILFWVFFGRNRRSLWQVPASMALALVLTAPWWLYTLLNHGVTPFLSAIADQPRDSFAFLYLFQFNLTGESLLTIVGFFAAMGMIISLKQRRWFLPAWLLLSFMTSQRAAPYSSELPISLLAVVGFEFVVGITSPPLERLYNSRAYLNSFLALTIYCLASGLTTGLRLGYEQRILPDERSALEWISQNVPPNSRFVILTGAASPPSDTISEWFPALTGKISLATIQGHEWTPEKSMMPAWMDYLNLQSCLNNGPKCIEEWAIKDQTDFSYIYIRKYRLSADGSIQSTNTPLEVLLRTSSDYQVFYDSPAAVVFARTQVRHNP